MLFRHFLTHISLPLSFVRSYSSFHTVSRTKNKKKVGSFSLDFFFSFFRTQSQTRERKIVTVTNTHRRVIQAHRHNDLLVKRRTDVQRGGHKHTTVGIGIVLEYTDTQTYTQTHGNALLDHSTDRVPSKVKIKENESGVTD